MIVSHNISQATASNSKQQQATASNSKQQQATASNSKQRIDLAFIILHYMTSDDTIKCCESIINNTQCPYHIVIVDNASTNNSFDILTKEYNDNSNITLIHNNENLGFAKGNNVGIRFARKYYDCKYVAVLNSDVILLEEDLLRKLDKEWEQSHFAVAGAVVLNDRYRYSQILHNNADDVTDVKRLRRALTSYYIHLVFAYLCIHKIFSFLIQVKNYLFLKLTAQKQYPVARYLNKRIPGCCMFFSNTYFGLFEGFNESTIFYHEENVLRLMLRKYNLVSVCIPTIFILHNEGSATSYTFGAGRNKQIFTYKNLIKSMKVLIKLTEDYCKETYKSSIEQHF